MTAGRAPRVLLAHPYPDVYGADRVALDIVVALRAAGMRPTVVLPESGPMIAWLDERGLEYRVVETPVIRRAFLTARGLAGLAYRARSDLALVSRTIADLQPDLVYANTITLPHWVIGARRAGVPVVVHVHESDDRLRHTFAWSLTAPLLLADRVVTVSEAAKAFVATAIPRLERRCAVIYNGVPTPGIDFAPPLRTSTTRLAVIGRLSPNKGQDLAIAAAAALASNGYDVHLEIVGSVFQGYEGVERDLRESVRVLGIGERVTFSGFCSNVWSLLSRTDIVVAPSRTDSLPLVVIEAMLAGRPIVAADVGGMRELIEDGISGLLVPPEDVVRLTAGIAALIDDAEDARRLGTHARSVATDRFETGRFRRQIVAVARAALARHCHHKG
jgi:glycosyltransferase involved in cell wall biosynthesis